MRTLGWILYELGNGLDNTVEAIQYLSAHNDGQLIVIGSILIGIGVMAKGWYNKYQKKYGKDYMRRRFGNWKF